MGTFLKWAGGKTQLLPELKELFPNMKNINGYIEPFLGGGSVFFYIKSNYMNELKNKKIYLSDINSELINCYKVVRDMPDELIPILYKLQKNHCENEYYRVRNVYITENRELDFINRAAIFIYLNKTCYNGLWRVNKYGKFNVPIGHKDKINIFDEKNLRYSSLLLQNTKINMMSFENIVNIKDINNHFVYMDPPYYIDAGKDGFTAYTKDGFHLSIKSMLYSIFQKLDDIGCKVMLSNLCVPIVREQYKKYNLKMLKARRMINSDGSNRDYVNEAIILNYKEVRRQANIIDSWSNLTKVISKDL